MGLKIVHINKRDIAQEAEVKALWENVLKPKWEAQARLRAERLADKLKTSNPLRIKNDPSKTSD